ncbi:MAG: YigZ family protein [Chloroflexi bacterium]|nr:YigZ family protein [Chloroflexota bacterium]MCY3581457.1 YigZ family protein [Chloroflexota bacterium]MCY3717308.1 YigZ family protein [Chloroflexota bacterium]MDE2649225.1 YigZ family protein [Chloroflexota bacterium]MXV92691.1 YigZ family protein [Chloroflexota bacterium]
MPEAYRIPAHCLRSELVIRKSRFVTTVAPAATVARAREFLASVRAEMPAANHHVYGFRVGFGKTVTEGMSDDGEPTGTAGPPTLAVLRGSGIGDIALVTTRFFGGAKLGTGGLVRAYTESAQQALAQLTTELKVERRTVGIELPYSLYNIVKRMIAAHGGSLEDEVFDEQVLLVARFVREDLQRFTVELRERTAGRIAPVKLD